MHRGEESCCFATPFAREDCASVIFFIYRKLNLRQFSLGGFMKYCFKCGQSLTHQMIEGKEIPYCVSCDKLYFPRYNVAVSMIVRYEDEVLLIHQYQKPYPILVAGYVSMSESLEDACMRELKEETNLDAYKVTYLRSKYYEPSQTLMVNFEVMVKDQNFTLNDEVDDAFFCTIDEALNLMKPTSLAYEFMNEYKKRG